MRQGLLAVLWLCACGELKLPANRGPSSLDVHVEPIGELGRAPSVLRLRLPHARGRANLADYRFFQGALSSYYERRLATGDEPSTLLEREIPVLTWTDGDDVVVAPARALDAGVFSLATPELGLVAAVTVDPELVPWVARFWPPRDVTAGNGFSVFCGEGSDRAAPGTLTLAPAGLRAALRLGVGDDALFAERCLSLEPDDSLVSAPVLPPALTGGVALEPLPLAQSEGGSSPPVCSADERPLGPACATLDDDRIVLRAPDEPALWAIEAPVALLGVAGPGASLVVHGFEPNVAVRFEATTFERDGTRSQVDEEVTGSAPHDHVVINEVLANPNGPESSGEWIELVNDGSAPAKLGGFELRDSGAAVTLPDAELAPGEFVLLVAEGFAPDRELDVAPAPGTRLLALPKLGQAGLANGGELLRLSDAQGRLLSRFPALASPDPGVSVARRSPDAPDADASSFGAHAPPGASPGAPNQLADP